MPSLSSTPLPVDSLVLLLVSSVESTLPLTPSTLPLRPPSPLKLPVLEPTSSLMVVTHGLETSLVSSKPPGLSDTLDSLAGSLPPPSALHGKWTRLSETSPRPNKTTNPSTIFSPVSSPLLVPGVLPLLSSNPPISLSASMTSRELMSLTTSRLKPPRTPPGLTSPPFSLMSSITPPPPSSTGSSLPPSPVDLTPIPTTTSFNLPKDNEEYW